jgi:hypothetical protein
MAFGKSNAGFRRSVSRRSCGVMKHSWSKSGSFVSIVDVGWSIAQSRICGCGHSSWLNAVVQAHTDEVPNAGTMALGKDGTLFVGSYKTGKVYAVLPPVRGAKPKFVTVAEGMDNPNGVAFRDEGFPKQKIHGLRSIRFGPDGMAYVPVGSTCNVCKGDPERYAVLLRLSLSEAKPSPEVLGRGIRDT